MSCREVWLWPRLGLLQTCWPQAFLRRLREEEPDDVMISPECRLWSRLQELTANKSPKALQFLVDARQENHDTHLTFVSVVYQAQYRAGRHSTIEHPWNSRAWKARALAQLYGFATYVDQCEFGLELENDQGQMLPVRKPTCLFTTRKNVYDDMGLYVCSGNHEHTPCEGYIPGQGRGSKLAEDYPWQFARQLAYVLTQEDEIGDDIDAAIDADEELHQLEREGQELALPEEREAEIIAIKSNKQLKLRVGARAVDYVARLHKNMGHPSAATLVKMLAEVQATENVLEAARKYVCRSCYHRAKPFQVPPSGGISSTTFGNRLVVDSSWIQLGPDRQCILAMVDEATRYTSLFTSWLLRNPPTS